MSDQQLDTDYQQRLADATEALGHIAILAEDGKLTLEDIDYLLHLRVISVCRGTCMHDGRCVDEQPAGPAV